MMSARPFRRSMALVTLALLLTASAPQAFQNPVSRTVASSVAAELDNARLAGQGRFSVFGFHIYDARLFVTDAGLEAGNLGTKPFALDLRYARNINGVDIAKRSIKEMEALDMGTPSIRARWKNEMQALFPNVNKGDHLTGVYVPGVGARFLKNGQPIGEIRDAQFARAFFAIWLDPRTRAPSLRTALLRQAAQP